MGSGRSTKIGLATGLLLGSVALLPATPAAAAVTATTAGTVVNVNVTGAATISFSCSGGKVAVNGAVAAPALNCSAVTRVNVTGDAAGQIVNGNQLGDAAFSALPFLWASTGGGIDIVTGSPRADTIDTGAGNDVISLRTTDAVADTDLQLGADTDQVAVDGTGAAESMTIASAGTNATVTIDDGPGAALVHQVKSVESAAFRGNAGDDQLSSAAVLPASSVAETFLIGGPGDDHLIGGSKLSRFFGQGGTNLMDGGAAGESFSTESTTDTINPGGGSNVVSDTSSLQMGRRTISNQGTSNRWVTAAGYNRDAILRYRTNGSGSRVTASADRSGVQLLGSSFEDLELRTSSGVPTVNGRHLIDAEMPPAGRVLELYGDPADDDLIDITVPVGGWGTAGSPADVYEITPADASLGAIVVSDAGTVFIHGPWTNKDRGFVHRATRDLQMRFEVAGTRNALGDQLTSGTLTRSALVASLVDSDLRRGADVDRTFRRFLRRQPDPGGRAYWIGSLADGKALWRFRAQLIGSNEYYAKAGATNGNYVLQAYRDVLGRDPDAGGATYWTNKLNGGADRGSVALQFLNSPEARRRLVDDLYLRFLDRLPTAGEQDTWVAQIPSATGETDLLRSLAASIAYYDRT